MSLRSLFLENLMTVGPRRALRRKVDSRKAVAWQAGLGPQPEESLPGNFSWPRTRGAALLLLAAVCFLLLFARSFDLQVVRGAQNRALSERNRLRVQTVRAPRGVIYDRQGNVLAANTPGFDRRTSPIRRHLLGERGSKTELPPLCRRIAILCILRNRSSLTGCDR